MLRVQHQLELVRKLASEGWASSPKGNDERYDYTPSKFDETLLVDGALLKAMEDRDEAQARLIAAEVLHVHELEQKRRQVESLERQLSLSRQHIIDNNNYPFSNDKERKQFETLRRHDRERQLDSDAELMSLCRQLAGEIASRTSIDLELLRLKEVRTREQESELKQKERLQHEVAQLREELCRERNRSTVLDKEAKIWKQAYQEALTTIPSCTTEENSLKPHIDEDLSSRGS